MPKRFLLAPSLFLSLLLVACSDDPGAGGPPQLPVTVANPLVQQVTEWDDYVGRLEAIQSVEVRPRASGYMTRSHFTDGKYVKAGQLLFNIDARTEEGRVGTESLRKVTNWRMQVSKKKKRKKTSQ